MTTTIGFTINWWLVAGLIFALIFVIFLIADILLPYRKVEIPAEEMQSYKLELINSGRAEIIFFVLSLICLMRYWDRIIFNFWFHFLNVKNASLRGIFSIVLFSPSVPLFHVVLRYPYIHRDKYLKHISVGQFASQISSRDPWWVMECQWYRSPRTRHRGMWGDSLRGRSMGNYLCCRVLSCAYFLLRVLVVIYHGWPELDIEPPSRSSLRRDCRLLCQIPRRTDRLVLIVHLTYRWIRLVCSYLSRPFSGARDGVGYCEPREYETLHIRQFIEHQWGLFFLGFFRGERRVPVVWEWA